MLMIITDNKSFDMVQQFKCLGKT